VFKDATLFFSRGIPNIATVIPAMDHIDEVLECSASDAEFSTPIKAALIMGRKTLNRYYSSANLSEVYRIAMGASLSNFLSSSSMLINLFLVLHPRHKLRYFKNVGWDNKSIGMAEKLVWGKFEREYAPSQTGEIWSAPDNVRVSMTYLWMIKCLCCVLVSNTSIKEHI
jgi:hypothetical protein